jgi:hypothetical protein
MHVHPDALKAAVRLPGREQAAASRHRRPSIPSCPDVPAHIFSKMVLDIDPRAASAGWEDLVPAGRGQHDQGQPPLRLQAHARRRRDGAAPAPAPDLRRIPTFWVQLPDPLRLASMLMIATVVAASAQRPRRRATSRGHREAGMRPCPHRTTRPGTARARPSRCSKACARALFRSRPERKHPAVLRPGLTLAYGFNHAEARRSFWQAHAEDSTLRDGVVGFAYVLARTKCGHGARQLQRAYAAVQKAKGLMAGCHERSAD